MGDSKRKKRERFVTEAAKELAAEKRRRAFERVMNSLALSKPAFGPRKRRI